MRLYLVGGTVRRHMLGLSRTTDADFAVEAPSYLDMFRGVRDEYNGIIWQERPEFVCVRARADFSPGAFGGIPLGLNTEGPVRVNADFTLCRAETQYSDLRHPDTVTPTSILEDLSRRDFTVNAVAVREDGRWFDPHNGRADAADHTLRCVGNTRQRMLEDPLRMLRAVRFAVTDNLHHDLYLKRALNDTDLADLLATLPHERVREELNKALAHNWRATMLHLMCDAPILGDVLARRFPNLWFKTTSESR